MPLRRGLNPLESRGNYSATSNNMKLVHWQLMGTAQAPHRCTKCNSPPINGQYTNSTLHNMKLVSWPLVGGLLHLVQRGGDWAGPQPAKAPPRCGPAQAPPRCTKCNCPPINGQSTNHRIAV